MGVKAFVFRLVLRTIWVRLHPFLALTDIYLTFLVPSINYEVAFSKQNLINLISDRIKLLLYDCELFFGLDSSFSIGTKTLTKLEATFS